MKRSLWCLVLPKVSLAVSLLALAGCAFLNPEMSPPPAARQLTAAPRPLPKPPKKQFGALWSEDSTWNDVYSSVASRQIGDLVVVKLDENTKHTILDRYDQLVPITEEVTPVDDSQKSEAEKQKEAAAAKAEKQKENQAPKTVRAFIREIRPRGMYVISGMETVRFGTRTPRVAIEAVVRDRDIDSSDSVLSDLLLNTRLDVTTTPDPFKKDNRVAELGEGERS